MTRTLFDLARQLFRRPTPQPRSTPPRTRLFVTPLEDRTVPAVVTVAAVSDATEGGAAGVFRLTRTDTTGPLFVSTSPTGTATSGSDYTFPFAVSFADGQATVDAAITPVEDTDSEPTETVTLTVNPGVDYTVGTPGSATIDILDNDAQVVAVVTAGSAAEGGNSGAFQFTRTGDLSSSLTVGYTVGGTATSGTDYAALSGSVTFAAGSAIAEVDVDAVADAVSDPIETVVVTASTGTGYSLGSFTQATVDILTTSLYSVSGGEWFNLGGSGSSTGWLVIGEDGGVWFATGPESDMVFAGLDTWDFDEGPAAAYLVEQGTDPAPQPAAQPPQVAPPPRERVQELSPREKEIPGFVIPGPDVQVGGWSLRFKQDGRVEIYQPNGTIQATVYPNGSVTIFAGTTKIEIQAPPKP